jgi:hypothetical protein
VKLQLKQEQREKKFWFELYHMTGKQFGKISQLTGHELIKSKAK